MIDPLRRDDSESGGGRRSSTAINKTFILLLTADEGVVRCALFKLRCAFVIGATSAINSITTTLLDVRANIIDLPHLANLPS